MKNKAKILVFLILTILTFSSCKDFNKEVLGDDSIPVESLKKPSTEEIKNDLLGNKVQTWRFDKLEEFNSVSITNSRILDELNLEIEVSLDLIEYDSDNQYKGNIVVSYSRMAKNSSSWEFKEVNGTVYKVESDVSNENSYQEQEQPQQETERNYPICNGCGNEIKSKVYYITGSSYNDSYKASEFQLSDPNQYHQICAEKEAEYSNNRNR